MDDLHDFRVDRNVHVLPFSERLIAILDSHANKVSKWSANCSETGVDNPLENDENTLVIYNDKIFNKTACLPVVVAQVCLWVRGNNLLHPHALWQRREFWL